MVFLGYRHMRGHLYAGVCIAALSMTNASLALADAGLFVPVNRSSLVLMKTPVKEIMIADPDIADVHAHNSTTLTVIGKKTGRTNVRVFDDSGKLLRTLDIEVGYDLPAIRKALKTFMPEETVGVEMVNTSIALTGQVRSAAAADRAVKIVKDFVTSSSGSSSSSGASGGTGLTGLLSSMGSGGDSGGSSGGDSQDTGILNMMKIISGQQVMLRVRIGEVNRDSLKRLGIDPIGSFASGNFLVNGAVGTGVAALAAGNVASYTIPEGQFHGVFSPAWTNGTDTIGAVVKALERDGLFKLLAEPNLVAVSGEQAEFLAGGEIPIPVAQAGTAGGGSSSTPTITVEYKPIGVSVRFTPDVISENRIRMKVQPEVSEVSTANSVLFSGISIPSISTRRAKTTVELAPGESFMIAGLIKDRTQANIDQLPGLRELPVLGALFRSTEFQRNESELVIAVTPYLVDPLKSSDVKLPSDDVRPASQVEMFFFGALGAITPDGRSVRDPESSALEGPTGFMMD